MLSFSSSPICHKSQSIWTELYKTLILASSAFKTSTAVTVFALISTYANETNEKYFYYFFFSTVWKDSFFGNFLFEVFRVIQDIQVKKDLRDSVISKHGDFGDIRELSVAFSLESAPKISH